MEGHRKPDGWLVALLALGALLRLAHLGQIPSALEYDEAANVILAGEIAQGKAFPIFVRPYTGKEALYFYLAAGGMALAGVTPFALRLTSAALGVLNVALTAFFVHQLPGVPERRWLARFSAALVAVSYWQVNLSRLGYRAILLPPLLALTVGFLLRGLREDRRRWIVLSGAWAGLSAYTYSSVRVLPLLLMLVWAWIGIAGRRRWRTYLLYLLLFGLAALVVFAPLGAFFLRNPETFSVRLEQVSVFSPAVNKGDPWGMLRQTLRLAYGMFTVSGDMNPLYNAPGKPVFDPLVGAFFYLGLLVCARRLFAPSRFQLKGAGARPGVGRRERLPYYLFLTWLPVMMVPNVLSASGVPHNLRAMALVPAVFVIAALGVVSFVRGVIVLLEWFAFRRRRVREDPAVHDVPSRTRWPRLSLSLVLILLAGYEAGRTYHDYVYVWALSAPPYYKGNQALLRAAELIDAHPEADPYVATYFHQHATLAVAAEGYGQIRWLSRQTLILPPPGGRPALLVYDHTNPLDPLLRERHLPAGALLHRELGPDGQIAFEAYWLAAREPPLAPEFPMQVNLGHTLALLGYDLHAPASSGGQLDVTLYVRVLREVDRDDYTFFAHLVDDIGFRWGGVTFFHYPSAQWREGETMLFRLQIPIASGAPPGAYALDVGVFSPSLDARLPVLNEAGQMAGTVASAGPIHVGRAEGPPDEWPPIQRPARAIVGGELLYLGSDRDRGDLRPGETLALTLYWQAARVVEQAREVSIWLSGADGEIPLWYGHPVRGTYPFAAWAAGEFVRDRHALRLPIDAGAGDYDLRWAVVEREGVPASISAADVQGTVTWLSLGTIHVHATDRLWEPPAFQYVVGTQLGDQVELLGYDLDRDRARPGDTLRLTLTWRCTGPMEVSYTVFTHLLDADQQIRGQVDNPPVGGSYPTTIWVPGEIVVDAYEIPVAVDALPGMHVIEVGLYDPKTMERLPVFDPTGSIGDRVLLAHVEIESGE